MGVPTNEELDQLIAQTAARTAAMTAASKPAKNYSDPNEPMSSPQPDAPATRDPVSMVRDRSPTSMVRDRSPTSMVRDPEPAGPPVAPSPPPPSMGDRIQKGIKTAYGFGDGSGTKDPAPTPPETKASPPASGGEGAPARPASFPVMGQGAMGGGRMGILPGGWMPDSSEVTTVGASPVPEEARANFNESGAENLAGAQGVSAAEKTYQEGVYHALQAKMASADAAVAQHQQVQLQRQQQTAMTLAKIDELNNAANAKIDTGKGWRDRGAFATALGIIGVALGTAAGNPKAGDSFNGVINREIDAQLADKKSAQHRSGAEERMYDLHMKQLGDQDMAIDATKKGLYENILTTIDAEAAKRGIASADPRLLQLRSTILDKIGEKQNELSIQANGKMTREYKEKFHPPQAVAMGGGTDARFKQMEPGLTVVVPPSSAIDGHAADGEGIRVAIENKEEAGRLQRTGGSVGKILQINVDAQRLLAARETARKSADVKRVMELNDQLADLGDRKASIGSVRDEQGVLREPEYLRAISKTVGFNYSMANPLASADRATKFLRAQNEQLYREYNQDVRAAGGSVVDHSFAWDPKTGVLRKIQTEQGRTYEPPTVAPEHGNVQ